MAVVNSTRSSRTPWLILTLFLVAINMRPALAAVGPLLGEIQRDLHASSGTVSLLTALPVACFGLMAPVAVRLSQRLGLEPALIAALAIALLGMVIRLGPNLGTLLVGTAGLGGGIAVTNVLMPALVKRDFAHRAGLVTGAYSTAMNLSAAAAAGSVVPLSNLLGHNWRSGLAVWTLPVVLALAVLPVLGRAGHPPSDSRPKSSDLPAPVARPARLTARAWHLIAYTAAQSVIYYGTLAWLPSIYVSHGFTAQAGGLVLSFTTLLSAPFALLLPTLAARRASQGRYVTLVAGGSFAGLLGVLVAPTHLPYLWAGLLGVGIGGAFPLALTMFVLRTRDARETARMSTAAQSMAYLVAAGGPVAIGLLHDATSSWTPGLGLLLICAAIELPVGLSAARSGFVTPTQPAPIPNQR